jgi:hypothetical protein
VLAASPGLLLMTACVLALPLVRLRRTPAARSLHVGRVLGKLLAAELKAGRVAVIH